MSKNIEYGYWKFFNRFVKFVGYCFLIGGVSSLLVQIIAAIDPELIASLNTTHGYEPIPTELKYLPVLAYSFAAIVGFLMIKVKPYFPKHLLDDKGESGNQETVQ